MQPNSLIYVVFLAATAGIHALLRPRWRGVFLLAVSWLFYLVCAPRFLPLLLLSTAASYSLALAMERRPRRKKPLLIGGLLLFFGILLLFKYLGFFGELLSALLGRLGLAVPEPPTLLLPAGVSFYTFVICGYLIDVYRGTRPAKRRFAEFALFVSFFPAVLSGPIERSTTLPPQLRVARRPNGGDVKMGVTRFLVGLFKKMVIADQLAILVNTAFAAPEKFTWVQLAFAAAAYSLQIYCDFSAYSDMAVGSARLFGIRLTENFDAPYLARSVKEFWRRWHISLSSWFRDYLYFPLGGSRRGKARAYCNLLIVFAVSGLWHGAAVTFVIWGLLNGFYQVIGALLTPLRRRFRTALRLREDAALLRAVQTVVVFGLLTAAWIFFRADSLAQAWLILSRILTLAGGALPLGLTDLGLRGSQLLILAAALPALMLWDISGPRLAERLRETVWSRYAFWIALLLAVLLFGAYGTGYDAQEFVYFQF